jgi:putative transcriptional regulator
MKNKSSKKVDSFRAQVAQSMAELSTIMKDGQNFSGNGRFTVRTISVQKPGCYRAPDIRTIRRELGVSQAVFAQLLGVSQVLVRSWERGVRLPSPIACRLLDLVRDHPKMLASLIHREQALSHGLNRKRGSKAPTAHRRRASAA